MTAYGVTDLADVSRGWFIWISGLGSVLRRLIWALLDPMLVVSFVK
jgi:hypothetical protein